MATFILRCLLLIASTTDALSLVKRSYPPPEACSGQCQGFVHDPNVIVRGDGTYFRFTTNNGTNIATAPGFAGPWTHVGSVLPGGSSINLQGNKDLWAPDTFNVGGTYYLYYSVSTSGSMNSDIGVATSTTMEPGSWTDHGSILILANSEYNKIDPNLFRENATSPFYLSFGSFWDDIFQVEMQNPPLRSNGDRVHLEQNTTARPDGLPKGATEGSYQFWWGSGGVKYFFLFFSSGSCCNKPPNLAPPGEEYKVLVCRSTNPRSGFVDQAGRNCLTGNGGTVVLASHGNVYAPGGQGVMYDHNIGKVILYYHYVNPTVSYDYDKFFFGWNKLDFTSGWPVVTS